MVPRLKVMTVLGTRPEVIRLAAVIRRLDQVTDHVVVHTGQNYDYELNQIFFEELRLRPPDRVLECDASSVGAAYGTILIGTERALHEEQPDAFLVLGDTNSAVSALIAKRMKVPVYHMEAGNRSFDQNVPEEVNRRVVDHVADFNLVYTEHARRHLIAEGLPHRRIYLTGSPLREVLEEERSRIEASRVVDELGLSEGQFFIASVHREENVDAPERLGSVLECLLTVADHWKLPVVISTHPRTRKRFRALGLDESDDRLIHCKPFGFHAYNKLQMSARCAISDSGSISEESVILNFPAVTLRDSMERPEALDASSIILTGIRPDAVVAAIDFQISRYGERPWSIPAEYCVGNVSDRVAALIIGTARLSNAWSGVRRPASEG